MNIFLDIETLPTSDPEIISGFMADAEEEKRALKAPSNYKDEAKIAEYITAKAAEIDASFAEKIHKTGFNGLYGSIACICYAFDDSEVFSVDCRDGEQTMLERFYLHVFDMTTTAHHFGFASHKLTVIGHNVTGFDLPFLKHRSIINRVNPIDSIMKAFSAKPWSDEVADTMLMWSSDREKRVSMDKLCKALGLPGKGDFDGSMVAATWPTDPQKVIDYCADDVRRTREIYKRLTFQSSPSIEVAA